MSTAALPPPRTLADLLERIGDVSLDRIRMQPAPGTATPADALRITETEHPCELVDGVLVEKAMGHQEARLAAWIIVALGDYLSKHDLGIVAGADGTTLFDEDLVRMPDVGFIPYENIPPDADPATPMPDWIPALAVEVVSRGNTKREIERKLRDYFAAGVKLVWCFYPQTRTVRVYRAVGESIELDSSGVLDAPSVLPGFTLPVGPLFDRAASIRKGNAPKTD
jgi:Uma2 family endonuclease